LGGIFLFNNGVSFLKIYFMTSRHFFLLAQKKETPGKERKHFRPSVPLGYCTLLVTGGPLWGLNFFLRFNFTARCV